MGQRLSCGQHRDDRLFSFVRDGDFEMVHALIDSQPDLLLHTRGRRKLSPLHVAATNGQIEVLSLLLDRFGCPDILNRHKQTPLMLATMHGRIDCVTKLIQAGANILMFDSAYGRTCLHYAAYYGYIDCLHAILDAAHYAPLADSWGFARFVNIRDGNGATPLHLAARQRRPECVHILLDNEALACASTGGYGHPGSTPLHLAARGGSLDCVRELLTRGADRLQLDSSGRIPFLVALKHKHKACAALLNPSAAAPLVWPSPLKFISDLNLEAKALLESALFETNKEREKAILNETNHSLPSPLETDAMIDESASEASDVDLCCICFDQICTIEVRQCGHQMCAYCVLLLCCHKKPNPATACSVAPACPFCRSSITQLVVTKINSNDDTETETSSTKPRRSRKFHSEGSSSFKSLSSLGSFGKTGTCNSNRTAAESNEGAAKVDK